MNPMSREFFSGRGQGRARICGVFRWTWIFRGCLLAARAASNQVEEDLVNTLVIGKFRVEGRGHGASLPNHDRVRSFRGENFHAWADAFDLGSADEYHLQRGFTMVIKKLSL